MATSGGAGPQDAALKIVGEADDEGGEVAEAPVVLRGPLAQPLADDAGEDGGEYLMDVPLELVRDRKRGAKSRIDLNNERRATKTEEVGGSCECITLKITAQAEERGERGEDQVTWTGSESRY